MIQEKCHEVADKYIEFETIVIVIDLILLSRPTYRHVLYNTDFRVSVNRKRRISSRELLFLVYSLDGRADSMLLHQMPLIRIVVVVFLSPGCIFAQIYFRSIGS